MNQSRFVQADVNESAEVNDILDFACYLHSDSQILELDDAFLHDWSRVSVSRVAVWLSKLFDDVVQRCFANIVFFAETFLQISRNLFSFFYIRKNLAGNIVIFRVNPGVVQRVRAFGDFQESRALLKGFRTKPRHFFEFLAAGDFAVCIPVSDDFLCSAHVDAGNIFQEHVACRVQVYANLVYDRTDYFIKLLGEFFLVYIVLIKADADCLGVDFDQFCQRVLQAAAH